MNILKKLIIIVIFIIFSIILFHLSVERRKLKAEYGIEGFREGAWFSTPTPDGELATLKTTDVPASTIDTLNTGLPLKQYCIKGSYNSAITGSYVNIEMIKYVLYRGCRFLDFEIFSFDGEPYVAMSTDSTYSSINTINKDTLKNVLATVATYAFSPPSPIKTDPVFINLRIKTNQVELYDKIGGVIQYVLKDHMFVDKSGIAKIVTGDTILSELNGKVIIVLDKSYAPTYSYNSNLVNYVNIVSGGDTMRTYGYSGLNQEQYTSPVVKDNGINVEVSSWKLVYPDVGSNWLGLTRNTLYYPMVLNYGAQVVLYPFYQADMYLGQYEGAFAENKAGIVPMSNMVAYWKRKLSVGLAPATASNTPPMNTGINWFGSPPPAKFESTTVSKVNMGDNIEERLKGTTKFLFGGPKV